MRDEHGAYTKQTITVTVNGANDAPVIVQPEPLDPDQPLDPTDPDQPVKPGTSDLNIGVVEQGVADDADTEAFDPNTAFDGTPTATGIIVATDVDDADSGLTYEIVGESEGVYGDLTLNGNEYTYTLNQADANKLAAGETKTEEFTIRVKDPHGEFVDQVVTVTVTGTNDQPTLELGANNGNLSVTEDVNVDENGNLVATGQAVGTDADNGAVLSYGLDAPTGKDDDLSTEIEGQYGTLSIDPSSGEYTYTVDNDSVQHLGLDADGKPESVSENFDIYVRDEHGAYTKQTITVTVNGANDAPEIVDSKSDLNVDTDDSYVKGGTQESAANASDSGKIVFNSVETMDGGKISFKIDQDGDGNLEEVAFDVSYDVTNGWTLSPATVDGQYGDFAFELSGPSDGTGEFTLDYTYTQTENYDKHTDNKNNNEEQTAAENLQVSIQDGNETSGAEESLNVNITVDILDDGPVINTPGAKDTDTEIFDKGYGVVDVTGTYDGTDVTANMVVDFGADGEGKILFVNGATYTTGVEWDASANDGAGGWVEIVDPKAPEDAIVVETSYENGVYTVRFGDVIMTSDDNENWTVTYPSLNSDRDVIFTFEDGDGDSIKHEIKAPELDTYTAKVESSDNDLNNPKDVIESDKTVLNKDELGGGDFDIPKDGLDVKDADGNVIGKLELDKEGNLEFTQTDSYKHPEGQDSADVTVKIPVIDEDGNVTGHVDVTITINDDKPEAKLDTDSGTEGETITGNVITGEGTTNVDDSGDDLSGADGWKQDEKGNDIPVVDVDLPDDTWTKTTGENGEIIITNGDSTLTMHPDGRYEFDAGEISKEEIFTFTYTVEDSDGDQKSADLTITVENAFAAPDENGGTITVDESYLSTGTGSNSLSAEDSQSSSKEATWTAPTVDAEGNPVEFTIVENGATYDSNLYDVSVSADGKSFTVTLKDNVAHDNDGATGEEHDDSKDGGKITVTVENPVTGDTYDIEVTVNIEDDGPVINSDAVEGIQQELDVLYNNDLNGTEADGEKYSNSLIIQEGYIDEKDYSLTNKPLNALISDDQIARLEAAVSMGADSEGSKTVITKSLTLDTTVEHNLTSGGEEITVYQDESGKIFGYIGEGADKVLAFEIYLDGTHVQVKQYVAIDHPADDNSTAHDDSEFFEITDLVKYTVTVTATDGDGDTASESISSGLILKFVDDEAKLVTEPSSEGAIVTDSTLLTDDSDLASDTAVDSGQIVFTSKDSMNGGVITIDGVTFTVVEDAEGNFSLVAPEGEDFVLNGAYGELIVDSVLGTDGDNFILKFTYKQTDNYSHQENGLVDNDNDGVEGSGKTDWNDPNDNLHDQTQSKADAFDVFIQDSDDTVGKNDGLSTTITVDIKDDGPRIVSDSKDDADGYGKTEATIDTDTAKALATVVIDFGADMDGAKILAPTGSVATYDVGVKWNGTTGRWEIMEGFTDEDPNVSYDYDPSTKMHTVVIGDVTMTSDDNINWIVSYDYDANDKNLVFEDGDGDSVTHTFYAKEDNEDEIPQPENPDIDSAGKFIDHVTDLGVGHDLVNWSMSAAVAGVELPVERQHRIEYNGDGFVVDTGIGNDVVELGKYNDTIYLGEGHVEEQDNHANTGLDLIDAQKALNAFLTGIDGDGNILDGGLKADDQVVANGDGNFIDLSSYSAPYVDMANGGGGNDKIYGEEGIDLIYGGTGNDVIDGGSGNDALRGGAGDDVIDGGSGNDVLIGGEGGDVLFGGSGDDVFFFGAEDTLIGGEGFDIAIGTSADIADQLKVGTGIELFVEDGSVSATNASDILYELGIAKNDDGTLTFTDQENWTSSEQDPNGYTNFTNGSHSIWLKTGDVHADKPTFSLDLDGSQNIYDDINDSDYDADAFHVDFYAEGEEVSGIESGLADAIETAMSGLENIDMASKVFMTNNGITYEGDQIVLGENWEQNGNHFHNTETGLSIDSAELDGVFKTDGM